MSSNTYSVCGRTLMVQFECGRCGALAVEPYETQAKLTEGNLHLFKPPNGWRNNELRIPMLCPTCATAFEAFMNRSGY